jgi:periplasmic divalent cation tolerance protein
MGEILIFSTADSMELAQQIAKAVVESREAACVNILPGVRSIYRWQEKVCDESELLLMIKSSQERFDAVRQTILRLHSYDTPEVISVPISDGDARYLGWLRNQLVE